MAYVHGITREDVFASATDIFAQGKNPTQAKIRSALGKGSFSTISKYLAEWREQQTDSEAAVGSADEMPDQIRLLLNRTYAAIRGHAETSVIGEQTSLLEQENENLRSKLAEFETTKAELDGLRFAYNSLQQRAEELTRENERVVKFLPQVEKVEQLLAQRDSLDQEVNALHQKNASLELSKAHLEEQLAALEKNHQTATNRANEMADQLAAATISNEKLNTDLSKVADRNLELLDKNRIAETAIADKLAEIEELKNELVVARSQPTPKSEPAAARKPRARKLKGDQVALPLE